MISNEIGVVVECGNTSPEKVFATLLEQDEIKRYVQIPYNVSGINNDPLLYIFEVTKEGIEVLRQNKKVEIEIMKEKIVQIIP